MHLPQNFPLQRLGINWQLSQYHGWGVFGFNLAKNMPALGLPPVKLLLKPQEQLESIPELAASLSEWQAHARHYAQATTPLRHPNLAVLHSLGNNFAQTNKLHWGDRNIGFIFFEFTSFTPQGIAASKQFDLILAGSRWNAALLRELGLKHVAYVMQGVDPTRFQINIEKKYPDRFVIFSGGKLEYRKGQDIVLAAFKQFYAKHPDALLITAWNNPWPQIAQDLQNSPHGFGAPQIEGHKINIAEWARRSGLPDQAFVHLDFIANTEMPHWYGQADVGLFPNRAEGGTNLVAMEVMATGVPCILSHNTGHLDLIGSNNCYPLLDQKPIGQQHQLSLTEGWGESAVEEIIEKLELAYAQREAAKVIGQQGKAFIEQFSWKHQTQRLIELCAALI